MYTPNFKELSAIPHHGMSFRYEGVWIHVDPDETSYIRVDQVDWTDPRIPIWLEELQPKLENYIFAAKYKVVVDKVGEVDDALFEAFEDKPILEMKAYELYRLQRECYKAIRIYECLQGGEMWDRVRLDAELFWPKDVIEDIYLSVIIDYCLLKVLVRRLGERMDYLTLKEKFTEAMHGYVYLFKIPTGHYKIGYSIDPERRSREIIPSSVPVDVTIVHTFSTNQMTAAESRLHKKYAECRIKKTEWFTLSESQVTEICAIEDMVFDWLPLEPDVAKPTDYDVDDLLNDLADIEEIARNERKSTA